MCEFGAHTSCCAEEGRPLGGLPARVLAASSSSSNCLHWLLSCTSRNLTSHREQAHKHRTRRARSMAPQGWSSVLQDVGRRNLNHRLTCWRPARHRTRVPGPRHSSGWRRLWPRPSSPSGGPERTNVNVTRPPLLSDVQKVSTIRIYTTMS